MVRSPRNCWWRSSTRPSSAARSTSASPRSCEGIMIDTGSLIARNNPRQLLPLLAAALLSAGMVALVVFLIRLSQSFVMPEETIIELRQVELSLPPPPPPPAPQQQPRTQQNLSLDLSAESSGPALEVARV